MKLKADFHSHHCFWDPDKLGGYYDLEKRKYATFPEIKMEGRAPIMRELLDLAFSRGINFFTITSCRHQQQEDKRWDYFKRDYVIGYDSEGIGENGMRFRLPGDFGGEIYVFHGQELKTDRGDVNILFAEKQIPIIPSKCDSMNASFYETLRAARDCGDHTIVSLCHPSRRGDLRWEEIKRLYEGERIDCVEAFDGMNLPWRNRQAIRDAEDVEIPWLAVSDGHRPCDLGKAYIEMNVPDCFNPEIIGKEDNDYSDFRSQVHNNVRNGKFKQVKGYCSPLSQALYVLRLKESIAIRKKGLDNYFQ